MELFTVFSDSGTPFTPTPVFFPAKKRNKIEKKMNMVTGVL